MVRYCIVRWPQVRAYDLSCVSTWRENRLASGAEEEVIRIFSAPENILCNHRRSLTDHFHKDGKKLLSA